MMTHCRKVTKMAMNSRHVEGRRVRQFTAGHHGLTLVEILVVICIITLLMAILFPALRKSLAAAYSSSCRNNCKNLGMAAAIYSDDYAGAIVPTFTNGEKGPEYLTNFTGILQPYLGRTANTAFVATSDFPVMACPSLPKRMWGYGHNWTYLSHCKPGQPDKTQWVKFSQATKPSSTVIFCDNSEDPDAWKPYSRPAGSDVAFQTPNAIPAFRHPGGTLNTVWLDGHAQTRNHLDGFFTYGIMDVVNDRHWWWLKK